MCLNFNAILYVESLYIHAAGFLTLTHTRMQVLNKEKMWLLKNTICI